MIFSFEALVGGLLIGAGGGLLFWSQGRIAGISGIFSSTLFGQDGEKRWRILFLAGLLGGGALANHLLGGGIQAPAAGGPVVLAGLLVGFGTRLGNGCTSGHGICGISRLSVRSIAATLAFMASGMVTATVLGQIWRTL